MTPIDAALAAGLARVGQPAGTSGWFEVSQDVIDRFGDVTLDDQWIHTDPARAAREPGFGHTIAHGFLTLSLCSRFFYDSVPDLPGQVMGINYGFNRLRFLAPVPAGAALRGHFVLTDIRKRSATRLLREHKLTVEIRDNDTPALVGAWLGIAVFDPAG